MGKAKAATAPRRASKRSQADAEDAPAPAAVKEDKPSKRAKQQAAAAEAEPPADAAAAVATAGSSKRKGAAPQKKGKAKASTAAAAAADADAAPSKRGSRRGKQEAAEPPAAAPASEQEEGQEQELPEGDDSDAEEHMSDGVDAPQEEAGENVHEVFMAEVHAKEEELQRHCIIMEQVETEEDETTLEQLRALKRVFVPQQVQDDFIEVWGELDAVGESDDEEEEGEEGEEGSDGDADADEDAAAAAASDEDAADAAAASEEEEEGAAASEEDAAASEEGAEQQEGDVDGAGEGEEEGGEGEEEDGEQPDILGAIMKALMGGKMLGTHHAAEMHAILVAHQAHVDKAIKAKRWQAAFCRWAATLMAARREPHWYEDTDVPADAVAIYSRMRTQWTKLRARSDQELGGLVLEGPGCAKAEFDAYLQAVADDMRAMDYDVQDV